MKALMTKLFGRTQAPSKDDAKKRLKFLLIHDQVDLTPGQLDNMKQEIIDVISKYVEIDTTTTDFRLERAEGQVALVSSVAVRRVVQRSPAA